MANITLTATVLPIIGIILGATLQYLYSKSTEIHKQHFLAKNQAYIDYLKCVSELAKIAKSNNNKRKIDVSALLADAKMRICIYGSKKVVELLADFENSGAILNNQNTAKIFTQICNEMRNDNLGKYQKAKADDLLTILFKKYDFNIVYNQS